MKKSIITIIKKDLKMKKSIAAIIILVLLSGCSVMPKKNANDLKKSPCASNPMTIKQG